MKAARIFKNEWFEKFARKQGISDALLADAVHRAEQGLVDAELGSGLIKQRVAREGEGKSGGHRTLLVIRQGDLAVFVFGFAKNTRANISEQELKSVRNLPKSILAMTARDIAELVKNGYFTEVKVEMEEEDV